MDLTRRDSLIEELLGLNRDIAFLRNQFEMSEWRLCLKPGYITLFYLEYEEMMYLKLKYNVPIETKI